MRGFVSLCPVSGKFVTVVGERDYLSVRRIVFWGPAEDGGSFFWRARKLNVLMRSLKDDWGRLDEYAVQSY